MGEDLQAFTALYERHADAVHRYASRRCDRQTAEEIVAQVFTVAWRRRGSMPEDPVPWLYGVARRAIADQRRGVKRRIRLLERLRAHSAAEPLQGPPGQQLADPALGDALTRIPARDREALLLTYWEELSPEQVAEAMGCSRATLAVRLHRARHRLRKQLEGVSAGPHQTQAHEHSCATGTESI